jgi:tetratricopeptide (TPR) repeat protein
MMLGALLLVGCASRPASSSADTPASSGKSAAAAKAESDSPEAAENRAEAQARYATGWLHYINEENDQSLQDYKKAALLDPADEALVLEVTSRLLQAKRHDDALEVLHKATARPKASGILFARLALVYSLIGKKELAIEANRAAIKRMPNSLLGYQYLAQIYLQHGQREEGLKVLEQAGQQPGADAAFLIDLAELYLAFGQPSPSDSIKARALQALNRADKLKPTSPALMQKLAEDFLALGETDRGAALYAKLLEKFPYLPGVRKKLVEIYLRKPDPTKAAEQLQAIARENPTDPQAYYLLGSIAFEEKKPKEAIVHFKNALLLNSSFEPVYYDLAGAQINAELPREALETLDKARAKFSQTFQGEFYTALAYTRLKDYSNAIGHFVAAEVIARATATNRLTHFFYFQLGAAYERNQRYDEAERYFRKCLEMSPNFSEALNYLGYMWAERGVNLGEARDLIEKAVKLEPENAAFLDSMGWVLYKQDKPSEALPYLLKAIEQTEDPDATLYDHLGDVYATLKQTQKARDAWQKSLSIEPNEQIQKKLGSRPTSESDPR